MTAPHRVRSATPFTPTPGANIYALSLPQTLGDTDLEVYAARIVVVQVNATKTRLHFPLTTGEVGMTSSGNRQVDYTCEHVFTQGYPLGNSLFTVDKAAFGTVVEDTPWDFEVFQSNGNVANTSTVGLFDVTDVASAHPLCTATIVESADPKLQVMPLDDASLLDGHTYEMRQKSATVYNAGVFKAALYLRLSPILKGEVYWRVGHSQDRTVPSSHGYARAKLDLSAYSSPVAVQLEAYGSCADDGNRVSLGTAGTNDGSEMATATATAINWHSDVKARKRSATDAALNDGDRTNIVCASSTASQKLAGSFAVVRFGQESTPAPS
jgi:hypothetical protein